MDYSSLEKILDYKFKDSALLREAITHPSLHGDSSFRGKDYDRLEFLGDAVVNLVITDSLYKEFPNFSEGDLAKLRAYLISKDFMVEKAMQMGIGQYLIMAYGEEISGGRSKANNLENSLEAIIGAVYLDSSFIEAIRVVKKIWGKIDPDVILTSNPKSTLQELLQSMHKPNPVYTVVERLGKSHAPQYKVMLEVGEDLVEYGHSTNIKSAEKEAARNMIARIIPDEQS